MKNNVYPCKPQFYYIKMRFKEIKIIKLCFRDVVICGICFVINCSSYLVPWEGWLRESSFFLGGEGGGGAGGGGRW